MAEQEAAREPGKPKKKRRASSIILLVVAILCFVVAGVCAFMLGSKVVSEQHIEQQYQDLSVEFDKSGKKIAKLQKKNPDCVAWLRIPKTNVDYPVMYTPDEPEYYLRRTFEKEYSTWSPGCLFVGAGCTVDSNCFIVYGHHMQSGCMFGDLENFNEKSFAKKHDPVLITIDGKRTYKVFTSWYEDLSQGTEYRYWDQVGDLSKKKWNKHIRTIEKKGLYDTGVDVEYGDNIMMLSTCSYGTSEQRFIVACVETGRG